MIGEGDLPLSNGVVGGKFVIALLSCMFSESLLGAVTYRNFAFG